MSSIDKALKGYVKRPKGIFPRSPSKGVKGNAAERAASPPKYPDGHVKCSNCKGHGHHAKVPEMSATDIAMEKLS